MSESGFLLRTNEMCKLCKDKGFIITDILQGVSVVCSCRVKPKISGFCVGDWVRVIAKTGSGHGAQIGERFRLNNYQPSGAKPYWETIDVNGRLQWCFYENEIEQCGPPPIPQRSSGLSASIGPAVLACFTVGDKIKVIVDHRNHLTILNTDPKKRFSGHGTILGDIFTIRKLGMSSLEPDLVKVEVKEKLNFFYGHEVEKV